MYEFEARVRYSEVDAKGFLKYSSLVNYLQDCSTFQSEDLGIGVEYLKRNKVAWVLNYWQIDIDKLPKLADRIVIGTIPIDIKGFIGTRNFYVKDVKSGEIIIKAYTVWTLIDSEKGRPARAGEDMIKGYVTGEKLDMEYLGRKIDLAGMVTDAETIKVTRHMLDTNNHVNNEQYIELALSCIPADLSISRIRAEYKDAALLGDILAPKIYMNDNEYGVEFYKEGALAPCMKCQLIG